MNRSTARLQHSPVGFICPFFNSTDETFILTSLCNKGNLSLTILEYVNLTDENTVGMLRAIRLTCPYLRNVAFGEKKEDGLAPPPSKRALLDTYEHQQLELELSKWPKVKMYLL